MFPSFILFCDSEVKFTDGKYCGKPSHKRRKKRKGNLVTFRYRRPHQSITKHS